MALGLKHPEPVDEGAKRSGAPVAERPQQKHVSRCLVFARVSGVTAVVVGGLVLAGWIFDVFSSGAVARYNAVMKPNTAACFIFLGPCAVGSHH